MQGLGPEYEEADACSRVMPAACALRVVDLHHADLRTPCLHATDGFMRSGHLQQAGHVIIEVLQADCHMTRAAVHALGATYNSLNRRHA